MAKRKKQLKRLDYDKLKHTAYELVVVQGLDQKEAALRLNITEPTLSKWAQEGKWREERQARQQCHSVDVDNTKKIIRLLSEKRLSLEFEIRESELEGDTKKTLDLCKTARAISDEISKHNKTFLNLEKENRITLGVVIDVMDDIFTKLRKWDEETWSKTIAFQQHYIKDKTNELG